MTNHITRIAPSPTGMFHIGSARTAIFNYLVARSTSGKFILRIDDTDLERNTPESEQVIYDTMDWLGLDYDIKVKQSDRLSLYSDIVNKLVDAGLAVRDGNAIRLSRVDQSHSWEDTVSGTIPITDKDREIINGLVLLRSDGQPTYHLASVVDDMALGVTWVIRGMDHLSNTSKHIAIWNALNEIDWNGQSALPLFTHVGLITQNKKKISKRDGADSMLSYRDNGIDPEAMNNWLLRLGWGPSVDDKTTATINRDRALELFVKHGKMRASPANMDIMLLQAFDRKYKGMKEKQNRL